MADVMKKYANTFLEGELVDLSDSIALLTPTDTPLYTLIAGRNQISTAKDITVTWREKELSANRSALKLEGAEAGESEKSARTMKSNVVQIMEKVTSVSGTVRALAAKGVGDEFQSEINDRLVELKRDCEYYFINGTKALESGATPRQMDGLLNLVGNSIDLAAKSEGAGILTENDFLDLMQDVWESGASGEYYAFMNATVKRLINALAKDGTNVRINVNAGAQNVLGVMVNRIETDFGTINLVLDRHMPVGQLLAIDLSLAEIANLRPAFYEDLAKTGDYAKGHVLVENTIKYLNNKAGGKIIGITA